MTRTAHGTAARLGLDPTWFDARDARPLKT